MRFVGIDPASKTGFVALAGDGTVLKAKESVQEKRWLYVPCQR